MCIYIYIHTYTHTHVYLHTAAHKAESYRLGTSGRFEANMPQRAYIKVI